MKLKKALAIMFPYRPDEATRVAYLLVFSVCIGVFFSFYYSFANAYFLNTYPISYLPYAFFWAGVVGLIISIAFSYFLKKMTYTKVLISTLVGITIFLMSLRLGFYFEIEDKVLAFIGFIFISPIIGLNALIFWGVTMKLFDLRQGKRLFGFLASGEVIASVFAFLSVPLLLKLINDPSNLLFFSAIGVGVATIVLIKIVNKFSNQLNEKAHLSNPIPTKKTTIKEGVKKILNNKYYSNILVLSALSMAGYVLVYFTFLSGTRAYYIDSKDTAELAGFFGFFFGVTKTTEFVLKTFFSGNLMQKYGLKFGLAIVPILITSFALIALFILVITKLDESNQYLFIVVALSMIFYIVSRKSFEGPAINMLFQPLKGVEKTSVQALVDGKGRQIGALVTGAFLILGTTLVKNSSVFIGVCLFIIVGVLWIRYTNVVSRFYKSFIRKKLNDARDNIVSSNYSNSIKNRLYFLMNENSTSEMVNSNVLLTNIFPGYKYLFTYTRNTKKELLPDSEMLKYQRANKLFNDWPKNGFSTLLEMVNDEDIDFVSYVVNTFKERFNSKDFFEFISQSISTPLDNRLFILLLMKGYSGKYLETELSKIKQSESNSPQQLFRYIRLIELLGNSKDDTNVEPLFEILNTENILIKFYALTALIKYNVEITDERRAIVKNLIINEAKYYAWIIATIVDLKKDKELKSVVNLFRQELGLIRNLIFDLLSIIYSSIQISKIKYIIQNEILNHLSIALEMSEFIMERDLSEYVLPIIEGLILDDYSQLEKWNKIFKQKHLSVEDRLKNVLNYNYQNLNVWIRVNALQKLVSVTNQSCKELEVQLFSPDPVLKETAFLCLHKIDEAKFEKYFSFEQDKGVKRSIKALVKQSDQKILSQIEIVNFLGEAQYFSTISKSQLLRLSYFCDKKIVDSNNSGGLLKPEFIYVVIDGVINISSNNETRSYQKNQIIGLEDLILQQQHYLDDSDEFKLIKVKMSAFTEMAVVMGGFTMPLIKSETL